MLTFIFFLYVLFYRTAYTKVEKQNVAERTIYLEKAGQTAPHLIALQIRNSYNGTFRMHKSRYLSSKHEGEGQGLRSVRLIAEKYKGSMKIETENQQFVVKLLLHV